MRISVAGLPMDRTRWMGCHERPLAAWQSAVEEKRVEVILHVLDTDSARV